MADVKATGQGLFMHIAGAFAKGAPGLADLGTLFREDSLVQAEGHFAGGTAAIAGLLTSRLASPAQLKPVNCDSLTTPDGKILTVTLADSVSATGAKQRVAEVYMVGKDAAGSMYIQCEMMRFMPTTSKPHASEKDTGSIGMTFAQNYYKAYAASVDALISVYRPQSQLIILKDDVVTGATIPEVLRTLPRGTHEILTSDVMTVGPAGAPSSIVVMITGTLTIAGERAPLLFQQVFNLMPEATAAGGVYIANEVLRFAVG